ncbi:MAG: hypothetical protein ACK4NW_02040 [Roseinatronobacter sp.]
MADTQRARPFYVYAFRDAVSIQYIGKGTGRRFSVQAKRFSDLQGEILATFTTESAAYNMEAKLIAKHRPALNRVSGGGGAITRRQAKASGWFQKALAEIEAVGSRRWVAQQLLTMIDESNAARLGLSKVGLDRLREVAHG